MDATERAEVRERAVGLLARREHSRQELRLKLRQRAYAAADVEAVIAELADENLVSDRRFAEEFVQARCNRGYGPLRIRAELQQRGVEETLAREALGDAPADWAEQAEAMRCKRFGSAAPADARERQRQYRYLANRGFTPEQIRRAFGGAEP